MDPQASRANHDGMSRRYKLGVVLGGYVAALLVACATTYVHAAIEARIDPAQASGGMQAFGDSLLFVGLFGFLALIPTALALYFLRPFEKFWTVFSVASLAIAATGPVAALMIGMSHESPGAGMAVSFWGLLKVLGAPLFGIGFLICAGIAPMRRSRRVLLAAAAIEFAVSGYAFFCLFVLGHWLL
jgi:hypothetical protein